VGRSNLHCYILLAICIFEGCSSAIPPEDIIFRQDSIDQQTNNIVKKSLKESPITFKSSYNGDADIELIINSNNTFSFHFILYSEFESNADTVIFKDDNPEKFHFNGKWTLNNSKIRLDFSASGFIVSHLFYNRNDDYILVNEKMVEINPYADSLEIWGIVCNRLKVADL
jgi:hypothetical protein